MESDNVIGAFSEEQASRISGVSLYQLRRWDRDGFFEPSFGSARPHTPFGRIYSFRDLVSLQVLSDLRNTKRIPLAHLKEVSRKLSHLGDRRWIATTLWVLGKRVVFDDPRSGERREIVSGQRVFNIPLRVVIRDTRARIRELNDRSGREGTFDRHRFTVQNELVFAGTRIPVSAVIDFYRAGFGAEAIIEEFPDLTAADVGAAVAKYEADVAA